MIDRRLFVRGLSAAVATASTLVTESALAQASKADTEAAKQIARTTENSPFRIGIIGPGSRGNELVRSFLRVPGVKIVAAADVYPTRFAQLNEACGYEVPSHPDYRALLDRKDLDAVVVATPLGLHAQHVLPALESGHHVYGEKTMAYTIEDAQKIVKATTSHKRIFQVGHQYRYSPWIRAAVARVQQGEIGDVTHILAYWNRNTTGVAPSPTPHSNASSTGVSTTSGLSVSSPNWAPTTWTSPTGSSAPRPPQPSPPVQSASITMVARPTTTCKRSSRTPADAASSSRP